MANPPATLMDAVTGIAEELCRDVAGDDLFLLAIAGLDPPPPARVALQAEGVTAERLRGLIRTDGDGDAGAAPPRYLTYSPAYYSMAGRADAFAACLGDGLGDGHPTPEHVLLALLWDTSSFSSQLLRGLEVSPEAVVDRLRSLGVAVPAAPLPAYEHVEMGERVWCDRDQLDTVLTYLRLHLGPGPRWAFNYEGGRAWVVAEAGVDLEALVAEALPPAIEFVAIDHVLLAMPAGREDDATAFYQDLLGLPRVPKPAHLAVNGGCWFESGPVHVHVGADPDFRPARKAHPALRLRGLPALVDRLRAAGVTVVESNGQVFTEDPFGNRVELVEPGGMLIGPP